MLEFEDYLNLASVASITMGQSPESYLINSDELGMPFIQGCAEFGRIHPATPFFCSMPIRKARRNSVLISVRAPVGTMNFADQDYCIGRGIASVHSKNANSSVVFLRYAIESAARFLHRRSQGSTFLAVSSKDLAALPIPKMAIESQQKIAEILSELDAAIEHTHALIEKFMAVMLGMTHDLLTRGIMPDGQLRPLRDDAPDLFKPAPFGWIPAEWDTRKCQEVCEKITVGIVVRPVQYYVDEGVPAFRSANVREDGLTAENLVFISERSNALLSKSQLRVGDVVSVRTGYPGTSAVIPEEFAGSNCIDILISRPSAAVRADYLASWINSSFGKDQVLRKQGGLAQQHFNVGELRELLIGLPPIEEQERIMARLGAISAQIRSETATRDKFLQIKEGLARDLLGLPAVGRRGREA